MGRADGSRDADCAAASHARRRSSAVACCWPDTRRSEGMTEPAMSHSDPRNATMRAAVFHGGDRITVERAPIPDLVDGEVLVRVLRTALCGSDFKLWHKGAEFTAGHEVFGIVEMPGHPMHGRRCAVYIPVHCGHCSSCSGGHTQSCLEISSLI